MHSGASHQLAHGPAPPFPAIHDASADEKHPQPYAIPIEAVVVRQDEEPSPVDVVDEKGTIPPPVTVVLDTWDEDPANPRNWSVARKWRSMGVVAFYTLLAPLASSMMAPGLPDIARHYHITSPTVVALTLSIYILAWAIGPLILAPLTEIYGRRWILNGSNLAFMIFLLAQIFAPNATSLIVFRFLAGIGGCVPVAIGGSVVSDLFSEKDRGTAMAIYTTGTLMGPIIGPISGGFIVQTIGFKYIFVLLTLLSGIAALIGIPLLEETYAPAIKKRIANRVAQDLLESGHASQVEIPVPQSLGHVLRVNLSRPFLLLTRSLICLCLSIYMALIYGFLYMMFVTFPFLFNGIYGWGPGISGLAYFGPGTGLLLSTIAATPLMNYTYRKQCEGNGGKGKPEFRIPIMFVGSALVPVGLFWYGWSAQAQLHWIMPILGSGIFGTGIMLVFLPLQLYLVDAFTYAASALAAASVLRALFGFAFPLFGERMFESLGFGGGNSLLAGISIVVGIPFPIWIFYRGEELRMRNPLNR